MGTLRVEKLSELENVQMHSHPPSLSSKHILHVFTR